MLCTRIGQALLKRCPPWLQRQDEWLSRMVTALVVASVVHLLQGYLMPLELPASGLADNLAARVRHEHPSPDPLNELAIVNIDTKRYRDKYQGTSPLDRCMLAEDLGRLLANGRIHTIAIDLFLSPTYRKSEHDDDCQSKLDELLKTNAERIVSIARPSDVAAQGKWFETMVGVKFGNADIENQYGLVRGHTVEPEDHSHPAEPFAEPFADLIARKLCERQIPPKPESVYRTHCGIMDSQAEHHGPSWQPIVFTNLQRLYMHGEPLDLEDKCLAKDAADCAPIRMVFLGSSFSQDDEFLTPLGLQPGITVHAAMAIEARKHHPHWIGFAIDIGLGTFAFPWLVHWGWNAYFRRRIGVVKSVDQSIAYVFLVGMLAGLFVMTTALAVLAWFVFAKWGIWVSPVPMAVGVALEGLVLGSVSVAQHLLHDQAHGSHASHALHELHESPRPHASRIAATWKTSKTCGLAIVGALPCLTGTWVVGYALFDLMFG